ncbi:MAG: glycoside hydrolase family 13 protein [Jiangellales bacterium]
MTPWWRDAVVYQVYIRSFADGNADGTGDLTGLRSRLPYLADLGVDAIWVNPWYPSPLADGGYDVADYRDINPMFGTLEQAEQMIAEAHALGLKVLADVVPNHTSSQHAWFAAALASPPGSPERARYWFRDGRGEHGALPPNDWRSTFGGTAWTQVVEADGSAGQWYLHLFDTSQPDLNWSNVEVVEEFHDILRFWFDRGVDGFRIDVAHGMAKDPDLPDLGSDDEALMAAPDRARHPHWDRDEVHEIYRGWRVVADAYPDPRVFVGEVWLDDPARLALYLRPDELHTSFAFELTDPDWDAAGLRAGIDSGLAAAQAADAPATWVLSNHDIPRHVSRFGRPAKDRERFGPSKYDFDGLDLDLGRGRARAAALLSLGLPGSVYLYQGEELGLEEVTDIPDALRDDPVFFRSEHGEVGRDGCRVPLPWEPAGASLGFGENGAWLPQPREWSTRAASVQRDDPASMLSLYRAALAARRREPALTAPGMTWVDSPVDVLWFRRSSADGATVEVVVNLSAAPVALPPGEVLVSSGPVGDRLGTDEAAWVLLS